MKGIFGSLALSAALVASSHAHAATLAISETATGNWQANVFVTAGNIAFGNVQGTKGPNSPEDALASSSYFSTVLRAEPGQELGLTGLSFDLSKFGYSAPWGYYIRSSADNYASNLLEGEIPRDTFTAIPMTLDFGTTFRSATDATFRFYGYAGNEGAVYFQNITFTGPNAVSAAPEPGTWAMMILGFGLVGFALRRGRNVTTRVSYAA